MIGQDISSCCSSKVADVGLTWEIDAELLDCRWAWGVGEGLVLQPHKRPEPSEGAGLPRRPTNQPHLTRVSGFSVQRRTPPVSFVAVCHLHVDQNVSSSASEPGKWVPSMTEKGSLQCLRWCHTRNRPCWGEAWDSKSSGASRGFLSSNQPFPFAVPLSQLD
jgi:hypothetical protein